MVCFWSAQVEGETTGGNTCVFGEGLKSVYKHPSAFILLNDSWIDGKHSKLRIFCNDTEYFLARVYLQQLEHKYIPASTNSPNLAVASLLVA